MSAVAPSLTDRTALLSALACVLALASAPVAAQAGAGQRRCPTCAPAPASSGSPARRGGAIARRGAAGAPAQPLTSVLVSLGGSRYTGDVDADCHVDPKATVGGPRAYYVLMYPWFGQRVAPDKPQWRLNLEVRRGAQADRYDQFVFSFLDGSRSATIQTVAGAERMGGGTVQVTRHGNGARFEVDGRSKEGAPLHAVVDCSQFQGNEGGG